MPGGAAQAEAVERYKAAARDKRKIPPVDESGVLEERELYRHDLLLFCKNVMPETFSMEFAPCHIEVLRGMQHAILHGGKKAVALPRGSGKTAMSIGAMTWGMLFGHIQYGAIIAADQTGDRKTLTADSYIPAAMALIYLLMMVYFKAIGGYKPVHLEGTSAAKVH